MFSKRWVIMAVILTVISVGSGVLNAQNIDLSIVEDAKRNAEIEGDWIKAMELISTRSAETRGLADLQVLSTNVVAGAGTVSVYGEIKNNGNERINAVRVLGVALDSAYNVIGGSAFPLYATGVHRVSNKIVSPYAEISGLKPGETGLFAVSFLVRGMLDSVKIFPDGYVAASSEIYLPMVANIPVDSLSYQRDVSGRLNITGNLKNTGYLTAKNIRFITFAKNKDGKYIGYDYRYGIINELSPNETKPINVSTSINYDDVDVTSISHKIYWDENAANAGDDIIVRDSVTLDGSRSFTGPSRAVVSYNWTLNHSTNSAFNRIAEGINPTVSDLSPGFYNVTLTVTDSLGYKWTDTLVLGVAGGLYDIVCDGKIDLQDTIRALQVVSGVFN